MPTGRGEGIFLRRWQASRLACDIPHHHHDPLRFRRHRFQRTVRVFDEAGFEQQILRRIPGNGQFWKRHDVSLGAARVLDPGLDQRRVSDDVADGRIDLGHGHSQEPHQQVSPAIAVCSNRSFNEAARSSDTEAYCDLYVEVDDRLRTTLRADFSILLKKKVLGPTGPVDQRTSLSCAISIRDSLLRLRCPWKSWR
ncbi:MAG: hypothetical protein LZF60_300003 [Nitrospira sp.]|nr:MAG: hypothetical protein LZF60_300003 [Nitrospira sp.]